MAQTLPRDRDGAAVDGVGPEDRTDELGAAGADEAGDAEHLARVHLERHVLEYAVPGQVLDRQQWLLGLPGLLWYCASMVRPTMRRTSSARDVVAGTSPTVAPSRSTVTRLPISGPLRGGGR
jgi:hypothetical protein